MSEKHPMDLCKNCLHRREYHRAEDARWDIAPGPCRFKIANKYTCAVRCEAFVEAN